MLNLSRSSGRSTVPVAPPYRPSRRSCGTTIRTALDRLGRRTSRSLGLGIITGTACSRRNRNRSRMRLRRRGAVDGGCSPGAVSVVRRPRMRIRRRTTICSPSSAYRTNRTRSRIGTPTRSGPRTRGLRCGTTGPVRVRLGMVMVVEVVVVVRTIMCRSGL